MHLVKSHEKLLSNGKRIFVMEHWREEAPAAEGAKFKRTLRRASKKKARRLK